MRYRKCFILTVTIFLCFILNCLLFTNYSTSPFGRGKKTALKSPLESIDFRYLIYNEQCERNPRPYIVLIITSFSGNAEARNAIRRAYSARELRRLNIIRVFLLAKVRPNQSKVGLDDIKRESRKNGDVLLGNFFESYRNLTYKHLMGLKWCSEACPNARYVAKMDDDIVVDLYKLRDVIVEQENRGNITLTGYFFGGMAVNREKSNKWFVTEQEYVEDYYPAFLSGWLYVTTPRTASLLVATSRLVPFFWIDDVYVTGLLAREADVPHQNVSRYFSQNTELVQCCIQEKLVCDLLAGPSSSYYAMHNSFKRWMDDCKRGLCKHLPPDKSIKDFCNIKWQLPVDRGKSVVQQILF